MLRVMNHNHMRRRSAESIKALFSSKKELMHQDNKTVINLYNMISQGEPFNIWSYASGHATLPNLNPFEHKGTYSDYVDKMNEYFRVLGAMPPPFLAMMLGTKELAKSQSMDEFCEGSMEAALSTCEALSVLQHALYATSNQEDIVYDSEYDNVGDDNKTENVNVNETTYLKLIDSLKIKDENIVKPHKVFKPSLVELQTSIEQLQNTFASKLFTRLGSIVNGDQKILFSRSLRDNGKVGIKVTGVRFVVHCNEIIDSIKELVPRGRGKNNHRHQFIANQHGDKDKHMSSTKSFAYPGAICCVRDEQFGEFLYVYEVSHKFLEEVHNNTQKRKEEGGESKSLFDTYCFPLPNFKDTSSYFGTFLVDFEMLVPEPSETASIDQPEPMSQSEANSKISFRLGRKVNYDSKSRWANDWYMCDINNIIGDGGQCPEKDSFAGSSLPFLLDNDKEEHWHVFNAPEKAFHYKK